MSNGMRSCLLPPLLSDTHPVSVREYTADFALNLLKFMLLYEHIDKNVTVFVESHDFSVSFPFVLKNIIYVEVDFL